MKTSTALYALYARDSKRRPGALRAGLTEARRLVASHLGVKAAEAAINA